MTPSPQLELKPAATMLRVLYVEDDPVNIELMRFVMELRPQVQLEVATDGLAGVAAAQHFQPELVLLDMDLPLLGGMGVLGQLKANPKTANIPCVAVSANSLPAEIQAALDAGMTAYIVKPFAISSMLTLIDSMSPVISLGIAPGVAPVIAPVIEPPAG